MTVAAMVVVVVALWLSVVDGRLTGGVLHHSYYLRLQEMPLPGADGAVFHGDVYTTAYRRRGELGCVSSGKFRQVFEAWTVEGQCRFYECLPNNSSERVGTLIKRMHNCGPPGPDMVPFLCSYTHVPDPYTVEFPACCPRFQCRNNYDPRRLMLPERSPVQGRFGNEVFNSAFSHADSVTDRRSTNKSSATTTKPLAPLEAAWEHSVEFIEFDFDRARPVKPAQNQPRGSRPSAPLTKTGATIKTVGNRRGSARNRSRPVRIRKKLIRFVPANFTESKKRRKTQTTTTATRRQPTPKQKPALSIADILF